MSEADELFDEAAGLAGEGKYQEAVEVYRRALDIEGDHIDAWIGLAGALYALGQYQEARDAARELLAHRPRFPDAWFLIGQCEVHLEHYEEAAMALGKALEQKGALRGRFGEFWEGLEEAHAFRQGEEAKALADSYLEE